MARASRAHGSCAPGHDVSLDGHRHLIRPADTADHPDVLFDALRDAVARNEVGIRRLQARRATLEDVFLGEVDPRDAAAAGAVAEREVAS